METPITNTQHKILLAINSDEIQINVETNSVIDEIRRQLLLQIVGMNLSDQTEFPDNISELNILPEEGGTEPIAS